MIMSLYARERDYDMFDDEEDSLSDNGGSSSEDEIDIILHGTPEQQRKLQKKQRKHKISARQGRKDPLVEKDSSSEDEFEKEMNAELNSHVQLLEDMMRGSTANRTLPGLTAGPSRKTKNSPNKKEKQDRGEFYDDVYFDSDEEEDEGGIMETNTGEKRKKHAVISDDELLYDPKMDDEDQKWVDRQRQKHRIQATGSARSTKGKKAKMPNSDALLDCPACLTTLCLDCQRHEIYKHQYRAMFVMNCSVDQSETLEYPEQATKKKKKKKKQPATEDAVCPQSGAKDLFHPVKCTECNTVVGVMDSEEVYHFFNILASYT